MDGLQEWSWRSYPTGRYPVQRWMVIFSLNFQTVLSVSFWSSFLKTTVQFQFPAWKKNLENWTVSFLTKRSERHSRGNKKWSKLDQCDRPLLTSALVHFLQVPFTRPSTFEQLLYLRWSFQWAYILKDRSLSFLQTVYFCQFLSILYLTPKTLPVSKPDVKADTLLIVISIIQSRQKMLFQAPDWVQFKFGSLKISKNRIDDVELDSK